ncbi:MAG: SIMPL domain-containing protein [Nitrospirales bacterium]|nr:SIMPL domain-containing protein [Nitrospirales bacterium]
MYKTMNASKILNGVVLGFLLLLPVSGWAETNDEGLPRLTVSAEGTINVPPDKAVLSFAVETAGEKLSDVQMENQERVVKVLEECRRLNIPSELIQTTSLNVIPEYPPSPRRPTDGTLENSVPRIIGYRVVHHVNVEVRSQEVVGKIVDRVLQVGANKFSGIAWGLQNEQPTKLEALKQASAQAQAKAEALAQALNLKLVRLINVSEGGVSPSPPEGRYRMALAMDSGGDASVSAGEISIRGSVLLVYEISQK